MARIVGIDLGSYSVKVVRLEPNARGGFEVVGYGESILPPPADGVDAAVSLAERHSGALSELKARGLLDGDVYVTGLAADAAVRTLTFPFADPKKIAEALPFALESEIPLDLDEIVLSWSILGPARKKVEMPTTDVLVAWARKDAVQATLDLLAVHDIDPRHVHLSALALDDLYAGLFADADALTAAQHREGPSELRTPGGTVIEMGEGAPDAGVAVVDIGHRATNVCVLVNGRVVSAHTILHGGADATRALAKAIGLPLVEAERGKRKEAFIEVTGAVAQFPEQAQISETLKNAYAPIIRRLRQIFQASISQARVRVVKAVIVGGGSRVLNLDRHMAEELNVKVHRGRELAEAMRSQLSIDVGEDGAPEAALAFAYALSSTVALKNRARIDFRTGEFGWRGDFDFVREKAPALLGWAAVLVVLLAGSGIARYGVLASTEDALNKQEMQMCKDITGKADIDSFTRCQAMIDERIKGQASFAVPERSAADIYLEIAARLPPEAEMHRKIEELDITSERVKMRGLTGNYDNVDKIVEKLQGGKCFSIVEKGKAQTKGSDIEFNITITLDCSVVAKDASGAATTTAATAGPATAMPRPPIAPPANVSVTPPANVTPPAPRPPAATSMPRSSMVPPSPAVHESADGEAQPPGRLTPEQIQERREKLRKLREERQRRVGPSHVGGDNTMLPPNPLVVPHTTAPFRPGLLKTAPPPARVVSPSGGDAEVK